MRIGRFDIGKVVHRSVFVHILHRSDGRVAVSVVDASSGGGGSFGAHIIGVFLAFVGGQVTESLEERHLQAAGYDESRLRDVGDGREVGIEAMFLLAVVDGVAICSGVYAHVLVGAVGQTRMRPSRSVELG